MEYYDHNSGSERSRRRDPGYREYRDQYGSYTTSYREESPRDIRQQHGEYRNQHYRGRASHNYRYSRGGGRGGYQRGDRDFRDGTDMRSEQYRAPIRNSEERFYNGDRKSRHASNGMDAHDASAVEKKDDLNGRPKRAQKKKNTAHHASHYEGDSDESVADEMDLDMELHPISHYLENDDREEMLIQVFKVIRGAKMRAMLTSVLKDIDLTELKLLCLEQLEGMSKKRIRAILAGQEMEDSSATEDEDESEKEADEDKVEEDVDDRLKVEMKGENENDDHERKEFLLSATNDTSPNIDIAKNDNENKKGKLKKKHAAKHVLGNLTGVVQFKSGGRSDEILRGTKSNPAGSSDSSGEDLETVIASGNIERKRKHDLKEKITNTKKIGFKVRKRTKDSSTQQQSSREGTNNVASEMASSDKSGKTLMELLELEMRARAIKALLGNKDDGKVDNKDNENLESTKTEQENPSTDKDSSKECENDDDLKTEMDDEKRLQKAREQLHISEAKKREEEELVDRKHEEIRRCLEEQKKAKLIEELEAKRKEEEELEKTRKAKKKQDEYDKFLSWKEERQRKKDEKQKFELKRQKEDEWYTRQAVREKEREMIEKERDDADEKLKINQGIELKRNKIDRVDVSTEWTDGVSSEDNEYPFEDDSKPQDNMKNTDKNVKTTEHSRRPRRYRRKNPDEDGQLPSDDSDNSLDLSHESDNNDFSDGKSNSNLDTSLSESDPSEKDDDETDDKRIAIIRRRRAEIRRKNRRRKPAADIEEGEVDSDGEHFEPMEQSKDPKIRMILHHLPKNRRTTKNTAVDKGDYLPNTLKTTNLEKDNSPQRKEDTINTVDTKTTETEDSLKGDSDILHEKVESKEVLTETQDNMKIIGKAELHSNDVVASPKSHEQKISMDIHECKVGSNENNESTSSDILTPLEENAVTAQKIEIDKPISDPVLLEARRAFLENKPKEESTKVIHPLRSSDSEEQSDTDNRFEETFEERAERKRKEKEERKRKKKMEDQRAKRFKRMQAFQARSGMQNFMDVDDNSEEKMDDGSEDGEVVEEGANFYKSYNELEEIEKKRFDDAESVEQDQKNSSKEVDDNKTTRVQPNITATANEGYESTSNIIKRDDIDKDIANSGKSYEANTSTSAQNTDYSFQGDVENGNKKKRKTKEKKKSPEEAQMEGVGFWARMCESQGDFEVPNPECEASSSQQTEERINSRSKEKSNASSLSRSRRTRSGKILHDAANAAKGRTRNSDKPNKEQVDREQEEMDSQTWADRWYQNKDVKKVMQHSQLMSKVRSNIKIKLKETEGLSEQINSSEVTMSSSSENASPSVGMSSSAELSKSEKHTPGDKASDNIVGSMDEYAKIVGKTAEQLEKEQLEELEKHDIEEDSDEDDDNDDDLWGAIMGKQE